MGLDLNKIKARLTAMNEKNSTRASLWKPKEKAVVRIVPYLFNKENPFIELYFHYGMNNKTYLSPSSYGRPDPIVELATKLKRSGDKEDYKQGKNLDPKMRIYVPVLVRGEESEGVKFWGFGKQVYQELLAIISDPDYGDITDLAKGRDITVEFKTKEQTGKDFPETSVRVKPNQSPAFDPSDKSILEKYKAQKDIKEIFPEPTYADLEAALEKWLGSATAEETAAESSSTESVEEVPAEKKADVKKSTSATADKGKSVSQEDIAAQFDDLFAGK